MTTLALFPGVPGWFLVGAVAVFGACIGSFLNVVIHRVPRKLSLLWPGSACPSCKRPIRIYENVPILAWIALRGRCRGCHAAISPRYVFVEMGVSLLAVLCVWQFGWVVEALLMFALLTALLAVALIDWEHMIIPDGISLGFLAMGLLVSPFAGPGLFKSLVGAVAGGGLLLVVAVLWEKLRGIEAMGGGDIKLMGAVGAFLGAVPALLVIFVGAFLGAVVGSVLIRRDAQSRIAFGTFLSAATFLVVFFGDAAIAWYLRAVGFGG